MQTLVPTPPTSLSNTHLLVIVLAQFAGTSLWFAGNAILPDIQPLLASSSLNGWITSAVQLGFISGSLLYALLAIPDRYPTVQVFLVSVLLAALCNVGLLLLPLQPLTVLLSRFGTGLFLAGVYPVGMKIAADWFRPVLGRAMGFLVGALVLGTALPHLIRGLGQSLSYGAVLVVVSGLAVAGGVALALVVPSKPVLLTHHRFDRRAFALLWQPSALRASVLGYIGHMWELYAVWAFLPTVLVLYARLHPSVAINPSVWAFGGIAAGSLGCTLGGMAAGRLGSGRVALGQLAVSGGCTLLLPFMIQTPPIVFGIYLLVYGATIAGDSPQLSTLVSIHVPAEVRGSLLTLVTCIGFSITIISIQALAYLFDRSGGSIWSFWLLVPGPVLGVWSLRTVARK
ncbi:MFS transporter [Rudanella paleaurantiibacter]|uniref:MFS transporter n=1 Tax=Rudanella paleaurantiibacter TaxID=2614655 RepID=A0A7J5TYN4_9BACT|nr:MFS transporter [Rudanella paleaurantiibacter]